MTDLAPAPATWVLLRGLTPERRHWGDFSTLLSNRLPGARVLALDLPGNGQLHHQPSPLSVPEMAEHCRTALAQQGIAPPYHLLAMSLGAMVATAWANQYPHELTGCVLINTSMRPFSPFYRRLKPRNYLAILKLALAGGTPQQWEETILRITTRHPPDARAQVRQWIGYRRDAPVSPRNALRQLLAAARYTAPTTAPRSPMLILSSRTDGLVDHRCSRQLASAWGAPWVEHPSAGHDLPLDDGAWVIDQVLGWSITKSDTG